MRAILVGLMVLAAACGGVSEGDEALPPEDAGEGEGAGAPAPGPPTNDAGADAGAPVVQSTTCCRLDNERGERLDYKCGATGAAISTDWFEGRGYRCWLVR